MTKIQEQENAIEDLIKTVDKHVREIDRLNKVLKLNGEECLAAGHILGMACRNPDEEFTVEDRFMLRIAGNCLVRIINQQEAQ